MSRQEGATWVVTGAAGGIGAAIARAAAEEGASVVVADLNEELGEQLAAELRSNGTPAIYQRTEVGDAGQVAALMQRAASEFGGIDVLVNNAGIHERMLDPRLDLDSMPESSFRRVLETNLIGPWLCARAALPYLRKSRRASIINAGSTASLTGYLHGTAYGASKGGIAVLTKCLAVELAPFGIRVNCYCPAAIETPMVTDHLKSQPDPDIALAKQISTHLIRRLGHPEDVAGLVLFLASEVASFITGAVIPVDGGSLAWRGIVESPLPQSV